MAVYFKKVIFEPSAQPFELDEMPTYAVERMFGNPEDFNLSSDHPLIPFRLYDDDDNLMYEGQLTDDPECDNQMAALRYGETDAGATYIKVLRDGEWKVEIG